MPARSLSSLGARHQSRVSTGAQFVTFRLGEEEYGIDISRVREIIRIQGVTHLPGLPSFTEGVINLRGHVIPVIDLRKRFRLSTGTGALLCGQAEPVHAVANRFIIVVQVENRIVGFIVDSVSQVLKACEEQIEAPPPDIAKVGRRYLSGICKLDKRMVVILDTNAILSTEESQALEGVA